MNGEEIRERISANNERIFSILNKSIFTLNQEVVKLRSENETLQRICPHKFNELGYCIYCDKHND